MYLQWEKRSHDSCITMSVGSLCFLRGSRDEPVDGQLAVAEVDLKQGAE